MCGICGIVTRKMEDGYKLKVREGLNAISHRGPDNTEIYCDDNIAFGYVRLAIRGNVNEQYNQPIIENNIVAFGNGEVYLRDNKTVNSNENDLVPLIRDIIKDKGNIFKRFDADFAISCYDKENKLFYLARDLFGVKPLYISWLDKETIAFASEIKALKKIIKTEYSINKQTILDYLIYGYQLEEETFYNEIYTISPGSILIWNINDEKLEYNKYLNENLKLQHTDKNNDKDISKEIKKSIKARLISDQKLGFHLSGGQDSSLIVYLANEKIKEQQCFTAYRNKNDNDLKFSKEICKKLNCKQHIIKMKKNNYKELIDVLDTPIMAGGDFVPLKIAKLGKKHKMKVLLEGQGADELFLGYSRFKEIKENSNIEKIVEILNNTDLKLLKKLFKLENSEEEINNIYVDNFRDGKTNMEKAQLFYIRNFLQELLRIEDHVHMNYSIENRVPFLSLDIIKWLNSNKIIINEKSNKNAEYNVHKKMNTVLTQRAKKENLNGSLNDELIVNMSKFKKLINDKKIFKEFDYDLMNQLLNRETLKKLNKKEAFLIWHIFNLLIWYEENKFTEKINIKEIVKERVK